MNKNLCWHLSSKSGGGLQQWHSSWSKTGCAYSYLEKR